jgi:TetR/AcrR family transcriptional regulator, cholesterol catabolism regulator
MTPRRTPTHMATSKQAPTQPERSIPDVSELPPYQVERRQKIIDVALRLLLERDGNVEVRDVVEAANVSLASVYRYFGSKEVLLSAAFLQWRVAKFREVQGTIQFSGGEDTPIHAAARMFIDVYEAAPQMWDLSVATRSTRHPDIVAMRREYEAQNWTKLVGASRNIDQKDAQSIVAILQAVFAWQMSRWRAGDIGFDEVRAGLDEAIRLTVDIRTPEAHSV